MRGLALAAVAAAGLAGSAAAAVVELKLTGTMSSTYGLYGDDYEDDQRMYEDDECWCIPRLPLGTSYYNGRTFTLTTVYDTSIGYGPLPDDAPYVGDEIWDFAEGDFPDNPFIYTKFEIEDPENSMWITPVVTVPSFGAVIREKGKIGSTGTYLDYFLFSFWSNANLGEWYQGPGGYYEEDFTFVGFRIEGGPLPESISNDFLASNLTAMVSFGWEALPPYWDDYQYGIGFSMSDATLSLRVLETPSSVPLPASAILLAAPVVLGAAWSRRRLTSAG